MGLRKSAFLYFESNGLWKLLCLLYQVMVGQHQCGHGFDDGYGAREDARVVSSCGMDGGILVLLVTMITLFLSGMNIVREKEIGTLEQINVTPIKKSQFIIGKLFPFWVLGLGLLTIGLIIAKLIFNVPMVGSLLLMYFYTSIYILVVLGIGLFIICGDEKAFSGKHFGE